MQETVFRRICDIVDKYSYDCGLYRTEAINENEDAEYSLVEEIETALQAAKEAGDVRDFSVETIMAFDGPGGEDGALCCAWIEQDGKLHTFNTDWHCH